SKNRNKENKNQGPTLELKNIDIQENQVQKALTDSSNFNTNWADDTKATYGKGSSLCQSNTTDMIDARLTHVIIKLFTEENFWAKVEKSVIDKELRSKKNITVTIALKKSPVKTKGNIKLKTWSIRNLVPVHAGKMGEPNPVPGNRSGVAGIIKDLR
ncbi:2861_t:CDS:2, partial [Gigaspora margarita]